MVNGQGLIMFHCRRFTAHKQHTNSAEKSQAEVTVLYRQGALTEIWMHVGKDQATLQPVKTVASYCNVNLDLSHEA